MSTQLIVSWAASRRSPHVAGSGAAAVDADRAGGQHRRGDDGGGGDRDEGEHGADRSGPAT